MDDRDSERAEAIRQICDVFAAAYLRLRFPNRLPVSVDSSDEESVHVSAG